MASPRPDLPTGTVTFLFTDVEGSTRLLNAHHDAYRTAVRRHHDLLRGAVEAHGGVVFETVGDAVYAAFASPTAAVRAALAGQVALRQESWGEVGALRVRLGLHTGEVERQGDHYFGAPLYRCARLMATAHGGQVVLSEATVALVREALPPGATLRDLGEHRLKDLQQPERITQLVHPELAAEFPPLRSLDYRPNNLPVQPTLLVGRARQVEAVRERLLRPEVRLLTLTGPGGTGKTRLGLQVAADLLDEFPDGVWLVNLAPITDPALVPAAVTEALGVKEGGRGSMLDTLRQFLRPKRLLLVLDNFEQVVEAAPLVADLLAAAPHLKVLVTSRAVLQVAAEQEYLVPPLSLPDPKRLPAPERLSRYEAVALFIQRALAARPDFQVTNENAPAVAEICCRLDGLPLAIELAAARTKLLPPPALLARLERRLKVLTGGRRDAPARQQTLRGAIDWSYRLLEPAEQTLFARLGVFVGGAALEAAETVCNAQGDPDLDVLEGLASLVDKSLVQQEADADGEPRFRMLETLREYALERLDASGEGDAVRQQHAAACLALVEDTESRLEGPQQAHWIGRLEREYSNVRAALQWWAARQEAEAGLRAGRALSRFWEVRYFTYLDEGRRWLATFTALPLAGGAAGQRSAVRAAALTAAGRLAEFQRDAPVVRRLLGESLAIHRALGSRAGEAEDLALLGWSAYHGRDLTAAETYFSQSLALRRELGEGEQAGIASMLYGLGWVAKDRGDASTARTRIEESVALLRDLGDTWQVARKLHDLAEFALDRGAFDEARALFEEKLVLMRELGAPLSMIASLSGVGDTARRQRDFPAARVAYDGALEMARDLGARDQIAWSLTGLARIDADELDFTAGRARSEEALAIWRDLGNRRGVANALELLAQLADRQGDYATARTLLEEGLALARDVGDKRGVAASLTNLGNVADRQGDYATARALLEESLALARDMGHKPGIAASLGALGNVAASQGEYVAARELYKESLALAQELRNRPSIAASLANLGNVAASQGEYVAARGLLEESLALRQEVGDKRGIAASLANLGNVAASQGDYATARALLEESLALARDVGDKRGIAGSLEYLARVAGGLDQPERAARLYGIAEALREAIGAPLPPRGRDDHDHAVAAARAHLDEHAFPVAWAEGQAMSLEQAIAYALEGAPLASPPAPPQPAAEPARSD